MNIKSGIITPIFKTAHNLALVGRQSRVYIQARTGKEPGRI